MNSEIIGATYKNIDISEKDLLHDILDNFPESFNLKKAKAFIGNFYLIIRCDNVDVQVVIEIDKNNLKINFDKSVQNPYLTIQCSFEMFCNITLGKFNPILSILRKNIKIDNGLLSITRFAKFGSLFSNREISINYPTSIDHKKSWKKPENILLVNGSPRKHGSTRLMLDWFYNGLPSENVEIIDISSLKIGKCLHCFKCWTDNPYSCVINDEGRIFREKIDNADLIVFFVPLSFSSMPSDMKCAFERLFPETTPFFYYNNSWKATAHPLHRNKKSQAFLQFLVWGFPEIKHGRILEDNFNEWVLHSQKNNLGSIKRPGINMILGDPRLHFVRKKIKQAVNDLAKSIYNTGIIPNEIKAIIEKEDYVSIEDFHFYVTNYWIKRFKTNYWEIE